MGTQPRGNKGTLVYVDSRTAELLGGRSSPVLRAALDAMATVMIAEERSLDFLSREAWNYLADALDGSHGSDQDSWQPGRLASEIEDADRLERLGAKWGVDAAALSQQAARMSYPQVQYILFAVRFFREAAEEIDPRKDEWWSLPYRLDYFRRRSEANEERPAKRGRPPKKSKVPLS